MNQRRLEGSLFFEWNKAFNGNVPRESGMDPFYTLCRVRKGHVFFGVKTFDV
jgi:hypothetical protein